MIGNYKKDVQVKVEVVESKQLVLMGSFKDAAHTLCNLTYIFGNRPIALISDAEIDAAMVATVKIKSLKAKSRKTERIQCLH